MKHEKTSSPLFDTLISSDALWAVEVFSWSRGAGGSEATFSAAASLWDLDAYEAPAGRPAGGERLGYGCVTAEVKVEGGNVAAERQSSPRKPLKAFKSARRYTLKYLLSLRTASGQESIKKKKKNEKKRVEQVYLKREVTGTGQMVSQFGFCLQLPVILKIPMSTQLRASEGKGLWKSEEFSISGFLGWGDAVVWRRGGGK